MYKILMINVLLFMLNCNCTKNAKRAGFLVSTPILYDGKNTINKKTTKSNVLKSHEVHNVENDHEFTGFYDVFDRRLLFSKDTIELTKEDMIAREADYENYKNMTLDKMKQFITIVTSTIAVGILYQALIFFKKMLEQQHAKLTNDEIVD